MNTENALNEMIESLGQLTPEQAARAAGLRVIAAKLDWTASAKTGAAAMAAASLHKAFKDGLAELKQATSTNVLRDALLTLDNEAPHRAT